MPRHERRRKALHVLSCPGDLVFGWEGCYSVAGNLCRDGVE